jgi:hypothetical protein
MVGLAGLLTSLSRASSYKTGGMNGSQAGNMDPAQEGCYREFYKTPKYILEYGEYA